MDELIRWYGAILDEEERIAQAARGHGEGRWRHETAYPNGYVYDGGLQPVVYDESAPSPEEAEHIARHDPARVLRDIEARRELLRVAERAHDYHQTFTNGFASALEGTLRLFALAYADHPGYRSEWAP
ncbi:MAG TPA: DUF6221 family protein [Gemmatimonadaceae bacterium]|jgi:hypothetical protein